MRSIALALATFLVFIVATVAPARAQAPGGEIEIEEAPSDSGGDDIMSGPKKRAPEAPEIQYGAKGFYGILAGTYGIEDFKEFKQDIENDANINPAGVDAEIDNTLGLNLRIGDRWHPNLATEVEFEWLDGFDLEEPEAIEGHGGVGEVWSFTINQKALLSTGKFQLLGLLGLGAIGSAEGEAEGEGFGGVQGTGFGFKFGGGFNYYFTEHFGLNTDFTYNVGTGSVNDLRYTSFSWGFIINQ